MRNYFPEIPGITNDNAPYAFNEFVCRFTGKTLAAELRKRADDHERQLAESLKRPNPCGSRSPKMEEVSRLLAQGSVDRLCRELRFIADHLPEDATFELPALAVRDLCSRILLQPQSGFPLPLAPIAGDMSQDSAVPRAPANYEPVTYDTVRVLRPVASPPPGSDT